MADRISLNGAVGPTRGLYFLLLNTPAAEDDESVLASARRVGNALEITPLGELQEFVSVETMAGKGFDGAIAGALAADGTLVFSDGTRIWTEFVPDESSYEEGQRLRRRMRTLRLVNGVLFATGFGGQVYRRADGEAWQDISFEVPELIGGHALFYHVVPGPNGSPVFGGIFAHVREITADMKAALSASDGKRFLALKRATKKPDHMLIAQYRDGWQVLFTEHPGVASWLAPAADGGFYLVAQTGVVWQTDDFVSLEERSLPETPSPFDDIKVYRGEPVFLRGGALWRLGDDGLTEFEPPLPDEAAEAMALWADRESMIAVMSDSVWSLDPDGWTRLELAMS